MSKKITFTFENFKISNIYIYISKILFHKSDNIIKKYIYKL